MKKSFILSGLAVLIIFLFSVFVIKNNRTKQVGAENSNKPSNFKLATLKFQATFPNTPSKRENTIVMGLNATPTTWSSLISESEGIIYRVDHLKLTDDVDLTDPKKSVLDFSRMMISLISPKSSSNPVSPKYSEFQKYPALEYGFKNADTQNTVYQKTLLLQKEVISLGVETKDKNIEEYKKFADSFELIN